MKKPAEPKVPVRVRRMTIRRLLTPGCRVITPQGEGEFRYMEGDIKAVVTLDAPREVGVKLTHNDQPSEVRIPVRSIYVDAVDLVVVGKEPVQPKKPRKRKEK